MKLRGKNRRDFNVEFYEAFEKDVLSFTKYDPEQFDQELVEIYQRWRVTTTELWNALRKHNDRS